MSRPRFSRIIRTLFATTIVVSLAFSNVFANGETPEVVSVSSTDEGVYVYMDGPAISDPSVQVGSSLCDTEVVQMPLRTIILVDNSLTTYEMIIKHGGLSKEEKSSEEPLTGQIESNSLTPFLQGLISGHSEGEIFRVGTMGDSVEWLIGDTTDYAAADACVYGISYSEKPTKVISNLNNVISSLPSDGIRTRILFITDGVDDDIYEYSYDELKDLLNATGVELYGVGLIGKDNANYLGALGTYIRAATKGHFMTTTDAADMSEIINAMNTDYSIQCLYAVPEGNVFTGSSYGILISGKTENGDFSDTANVVMPIKKVEPTPIPTPTPEPTKEITPSPTPLPESEPEVTAANETESVTTTEETIETEPSESTEDAPIEETTGVAVKSIILLVVMIIFLLGGLGAVGFLLYKNVFKKKKTAVAVIEHQPKVEPDADKGPLRVKYKTVFKKGSASPNPMSISENNRFIVFTHVKDTSNYKAGTYMAVPFNNDKITIGQDQSCDLVLNDGSLGRTHCTFSLKNEQLNLRDNDSVNGTTYNGIAMDSSDKVIFSGGILAIGREQMKVDLHDGTSAVLDTSESEG